MSKYFSLKEMTASTTASNLKINNTPGAEERKHLEELMEVLDEVREAYGGPIRVTSGYRCSKLNKLVNGAATSVHKIGYAADLQPVDGNIKRLFFICQKVLPEVGFDQLLYEKSGSSIWVHVGLYNNEHKQRRQIKEITVK